MGLLPEGTREIILGADDLQVVEVLVPEWKCKVFVKTLMGFERDRWELSLTALRKKVEERGEKWEINNVRASFCAMCICDSKGNLLFTSDDIEKLGNKNGGALDRIYDKAHELNRLREEDVVALVKNLESKTT